MKNLLIFFVLMILCFNSYSQKKKRKAIPPPVPDEYIMKPSTDTLSLQEGRLPILFEWKMNADTTLQPGTVYKELIKLTYGQTEVNGNYSLQPITLKKVTSGDAPEPEIPKMITRVNYYDVAIANGIITFIERGRTVMTLKVIYDKNKVLTHLKDLNKKAIYRHIESIEPVIAPGSM